MISLLQLLREVGEATKAPYAWQQKEEGVYTFVADDAIDSKGNEVPDVRYRVTMDKLVFDTRKEIYYNLAFGIIGVSYQGDDEPVVNYDVTNKDAVTGNVFRVMSTVIDIIQSVLKDQVNDPEIKDVLNDYTTFIVMYPSKRKTATGEDDESDTRRADLYVRYMEKNMHRLPPGSRIEKEVNSYKIQIVIPPKKNQK